MADEHRKWARYVWPRICRNIEVRRVSGLVSPDRNCDVEYLTAMIPSQQMYSTGRLSVGDADIPVAWVWTITGYGKDDVCKFDPIATEAAEFLMVRSGEFRNWQIVEISDDDSASFRLFGESALEKCRTMSSDMR
ncbi:hypothetical protein [Croceicoccus naphthovorans]|uniref:hypothetical protein n=1 Tax=Croceicoccus naphthovorans TaxID=1348774 RepID=UPI0012E00907|nr:hypothetical protein [Croceicoccus naphthovorans]MBB3989391.1 hypothetical protein [Croceicoccus naphthovorans]